MKLTFSNIIMELNVFNIQQQSMRYDWNHSTINWVDEFSSKELDFDHELELMLCVPESFCIDYKHD